MKQKDSVTRTGTFSSGTALNLCREARSKDAFLIETIQNPIQVVQHVMKSLLETSQYPPAEVNGMLCFSNHRELE